MNIVHPDSLEPSSAMQMIAKRISQSVPVGKEFIALWFSPPPPEWDKGDPTPAWLAEADCVCSMEPKEMIPILAAYLRILKSEGTESIEGEVV